MLTMEAPYRLFGLRLRAARRKAGLNQTELAVAIGVRQGTISGYETGIYIPSLDTAARLARALGVSLDSLVPPDATEGHDGES